MKNHNTSPNTRQTLNHPKTPSHRNEIPIVQNTFLISLLNLTHKITLFQSSKHRRLEVQNIDIESVEDDTSKNSLYKTIDEKTYAGDVEAFFNPKNRFLAEYSTYLVDKLTSLGATFNMKIQKHIHTFNVIQSVTYDGLTFSEKDVLRKGFFINKILVKRIKDNASQDKAVLFPKDLELMSIIINV
ncbi:hypothetical protein EIN_391070 [Entamoeba invadens IP1]|uniref:Uncharacterized protein n=1 Tax=Entamoeba invadens IP1 TaxID=370355 RepID=A0A0A1U5G7_ENTIV|nr:hypothetical protein EIN_391070 [Entamoeba invadens IP1]ELP89472.1 hypothetical protein EIN_391070 [Entamoeba invadens IP1]|eukprot:XP_004256243.1 hypothetical protein EIN_391070 [Entamoeba invadens IP1]